MIAACYVLLPLVAGAFSGAAFTYMARWFGWLPNVASAFPISAMLGLLSYVVLAIAYPIVTEHFSPMAIWRGTLVALVMLWPITLVIGPIFFVYVAHLRKGRKILKDKTIFVISVLCLVSECVFLFFFFDDVS